MENDDNDDDGDDGDDDDDDDDDADDVDDVDGMMGHLAEVDKDDVCLTTTGAFALITFVNIGNITMRIFPNALQTTGCVLLMSKNACGAIEPT
eukprot:3305230-Amphidinium_carterae.1